MYIQIINFSMETTADEYDSATVEFAPIFANIDGLTVKNFLYSHETKTCGDCYIQKTKEATEAYKNDEIYNMIIENPDFKNVTSKEFCVHAKANEIQKELKSQQHFLVDPNANV